MRFASVMYWDFSPSGGLSLRIISGTRDTGIFPRACGSNSVQTSTNSLSWAWVKRSTTFQAAGMPCQGAKLTTPPWTAQRSFQ
eukprot:758314-Hanusia_phi.AAC.6